MLNISLQSAEYVSSVAKCMTVDAFLGKQLALSQAADVRVFHVFHQLMLDGRTPYLHAALAPVDTGCASFWS